jgi:molybdopterin-binding protein
MDFLFILFSPSVITHHNVASTFLDEPSILDTVPQILRFYSRMPDIGLRPPPCRAPKIVDDANRRKYPSPMTLSARNRLEGTITELQLGGVMAHVVIKVGNNLIESVITRRSAEEMQLKIGDTVSAVIKSTEVMLEKK